MKKKNLKKIVPIFLLLLMTIYFLFITIHLTVNCTHDSTCQVCLLLHNIKNNLNGFNPNDDLKIFVFLVFFVLLNEFIDIKRDKKKNTLVGLKIKLLN